MIPFWPDVAKNLSGTGTKAEIEFAQTFAAMCSFNYAYSRL